MSILLISKTKDFKPLKEEILQQDPELHIEIWPAVRNRKTVQMAVCWKHTKGALEPFPNLKCIMSYGAGVDHLLHDKSLPEVDICRMVLPSLNDQMADYVLMMCLILQRKYRNYDRHSSQQIWNQLEVHTKQELSVGVMGAGQTGTAIAERLAKNGFTVNTWSNSEHHIPDVRHFAGQLAFHPFLNESHILVCSLPLTMNTEGVLNLNTFKALQKPAYLINIGRGRHLVEEDLIYALDADILKEAVLDTLETEPLPQNHTFWNRDEIIITPHIAALTNPKEAATLIINNYKRIISGMKPLHKVDRLKGY